MFYRNLLVHERSMVTRVSVVFFGRLCEDEHPSICTRFAAFDVEEIWIHMDYTTIGDLRGSASYPRSSVFEGERLGLYPEEFRFGTTVLFRVDSELEVFARGFVPECLVGPALAGFDRMHVSLFLVL